MYIVNLLESRNTRSIFIWCLPYFLFDYRSADWKALELSIHRRSRLLFHPEFCRIIFSYLNSGMIYVISFSYENRWRQNSDRKTRWFYLISPTSVRSQITGGLEFVAFWKVLGRFIFFVLSVICCWFSIINQQLYS